MGKLKTENVQNLVEKISHFVSHSSGLRLEVADDGSVDIHQKTDQRMIKFKSEELSDVLSREDKEGKSFIQVNFVSGRKILLTDTLVGFKPEPRASLDLSRLPRVVTTPDLLSVFEAIEEVMNSDANNNEEISVLKEVYHSILSGGEAVGFDLKSERIWLSRILVSNRATA
ncbi:MAG: hypothetical protein AB7F59_07050 [Bdellovibrionales bacterium]